jgi:hypothetical protein
MILSPKDKENINKLESMSKNLNKLPKYKQTIIKRLSFGILKIYANAKLNKAKKEKNETDIKFFVKFLDALKEKNEDVIETCLIQQGLIKPKK